MKQEVVYVCTHHIRPMTGCWYQQTTYGTIKYSKMIYTHMQIYDANFIASYLNIM